MNNDISSEITSYMKTNARHAKIKKSMPKVQTEENISNKDYEARQNYLNALGRTKVNMDKIGIDNRVLESVMQFREDPEYAQTYIDFCDSIQEKGYPLEDAIIGTDIIFDKLKDRETYTS